MFEQCDIDVLWEAHDLLTKASTSLAEVENCKTDRSLMRIRADIRFDIRAAKAKIRRMKKYLQDGKIKNKDKKRIRKIFS